MKFKPIHFLFILFGIQSSFSQETQSKDSLDLNQVQDLDVVVLTGQYKPQQVNKSIFEVDVITQSDIRKMAGNTLDDVLKQSLNLNIIPNSGEGRSGVEQFGFNSEYIKILVDGVPIVGDEGFGNAIDISQINLDDIEQIEIVEGAMGVQYGANAVTGVINIITKKSSLYRWQITPYIQEETIGNEYNWSDKGRHIQSVKIAHNFSDSWYGEAAYTRNDFRGFFGEKKGKFHFDPEDSNNLDRGYDWLPKEQNNVKALVNFNSGSFRSFYKFEYFHEQTDKFSNKVHLNRNGATQTVDPTSNDQIFRTDRMYHHLNFTGLIQNRMNYNISVSYQEQVRNVESFTRKLLTGTKSNENRYDYNTRKGFFSRGTLNQILSSENYNFEVGYEFNSDRGMAGGLSEQNTATDLKTREVNSLSGFASAEFQPGARISFRPGFRYIHSNKFSNQYALSLSGKYQFNNGYELRMVAGSAPKLPNFEELYFLMVDSNHDVRGNENLKPEKGKSVFLHLKKNYAFQDGNFRFQPKISVWYLDVKDKIDLIIAETSPLAFQFENIDTYRTWGMALRNKIYYENLSAGLGISLNGESKILDSAEDYDDSYLYAVQITGQTSYNIPSWNTTFSAYYKFNGAQYQFVTSVDDNGDPLTVKEKQEPFSWLDISVRKTFLQDHLELTLGARNVLDVVSVKTTATTGQGHSTSDRSMLLGYGRSFFVKLLYNLNL